MMSRNFFPLHLSIHYYADENAVLQCRVYETIANGTTVDYDMTRGLDGMWELDAFLPVPQNATEVYLRFRVMKGGTVIDSELRNCYHVFPCRHEKTFVECMWNTDDESSVRYSNAFTKCLYQYDIKHFNNSETSGDRIFVNNILLADGTDLVMVGNLPAMGNWDPFRAVALERMTGCSYSCALPEVEEDFEFKFVAINRTTNEVFWEEGGNRVYKHSPLGERHYGEYMPRLQQKKMRAAGVVIPVFSLRSNNSWGVGDFGDVCRMVDWAASCHLHVLQVLPINDTSRDGSWMDSYPYNAISAFALHPLYADLSRLPALSDSKRDAAFRAEALRLNQLPLMDYEAVIKLKNGYLDAFFKEHQEDITRSSELKDYIASNREWIVPYCAYKVLQRVFGTPDFHRWGAFSKYDETNLMQWFNKEQRYVEFQYFAWVQMILDAQMREAHAYARRKGVVLKGDIPIGISRESATAWVNEKYFNFDSQAGAPPDFFSEKGQNWGFPTYNWGEILRDGGRWWQHRLRRMADYFDAYRIDHVLGFFRIWEIPYECLDGTLGHFNPALPLSEKEIRDFGFTDTPEQYTRPMLYAEDLQAYFGDASGKVRIRYFELVGNSPDVYTLRPQYASSRQIVAETVEPNICEALLRVQAEVLFIRDKADASKYHLNIAANRTRTYQRLSQVNREAYNRLGEHYFFHRHDAYWTEEAMKKLPLLVNASHMLPCAEDLGMIPQCMRTVLGKLHILSLEVESMPKYSWGRFADVMQNPYLSVDTISTHDMQPLRLWWRKNQEASRDYYWNVLHHEGNPPCDMTAALAIETVRRHLEGPSMLCVLALQDWLAMSAALSNPDIESEQINQPAVSRHYWRYRMHINIEKLDASMELRNLIRELVTYTGRK